MATASVFAELEREAIIRAMKRPPINGKYYELWIQNATIVGRFIRENQLQPMAIAEEGMAASHAATAGGTVTVTAGGEDIRWWSKWGGMKAAHLHFRDGTYVLTRDQWSAFTKDVTTAMVAKIQGAGEVGYEGYMGMTEGVGLMH